MSGSLNKVMLIGNLGDDVKMHHFEGGGCIGRFPIATNETYNNKVTGEKISNTEWHNIVVKNKAAEICEKYLKKGDKIYVEGRIKTRKWQSEDGVQRYSTEIHVSDFNFLTKPFCLNLIANFPASKKLSIKLSTIFFRFTFIFLVFLIQYFLH